MCNEMLGERSGTLRGRADRWNVLVFYMKKYAGL